MIREISIRHTVTVQGRRHSFHVGDKIICERSEKKFGLSPTTAVWGGGQNLLLTVFWHSATNES